MDENWKARYDAMRKYYGYKNADVAAITGHTPSAVRQMITTKEREFPRWLRLAIVNFEKEHLTAGPTVDIPPSDHLTDHESPEANSADNPAHGGTD